VGVGRSGVDAVDQAQHIIDTNVHFHAEVPLIALLGLVHLRVAFAALVIGGAGRLDDRGIHNATFTQHQAVLFQKMTEVENGCLIRKPFYETKAGEAAHGLDLVQAILHGWIAQVIKELHAVNAEDDGRRRSSGSSRKILYW
jgi:hypothetical protein